MMVLRLEGMDLFLFCFPVLVMCFAVPNCFCCSCQPPARAAAGTSETLPQAVAIRRFAEILNQADALIFHDSRGDTDMLRKLGVVVDKPILDTQSIAWGMCLAAPWLPCPWCGCPTAPWLPYLVYVPRSPLVTTPLVTMSEMGAPQFIGYHDRGYRACRRCPIPCR